MPVPDEPNAYLDSYNANPLQDVLDRELLHVHTCTSEPPHEYECRVMICRDQRVHRCWDHRMSAPSERPRSS